MTLSSLYSNCISYTQGTISSVTTLISVGIGQLQEELNQVVQTTRQIFENFQNIPQVFQNTQNITRESDQFIRDAIFEDTNYQYENLPQYDVESLDRLVEIRDGKNLEDLDVFPGPIFKGDIRDTEYSFIAFRVTSEKKSNTLISKMKEYYFQEPNDVVSEKFIVIVRFNRGWGQLNMKQITLAGNIFNNSRVFISSGDRKNSIEKLHSLISGDSFQDNMGNKWSLSLPKRYMKRAESQ